MSRCYKLDGNKNVISTDSPEMTDDERRVAYTISKNGTFSVSTVFLEYDHSWEPGHLHVFETLVFGGKYDEEMVRYSTWNEAIYGHYVMCKKVFEWSDEEFKEVIAENFVEFL